GVGAAQPNHVPNRRLGTFERAEGERHVGAKEAGSGELLPRKVQARSVAAQQRQPLVRVENAAGFADPPFVDEINRLGKLDHLAAGEILDNALAKLLVLDPKVAEVAA